MAVAFLAEVLILPATIKLLPRWLGAESLRKRRGAAVAAMSGCVCVAGRRLGASVGRPSGNVSLTADYEPNRNDTLELAESAVRRGEDRGDAVAAPHRVGVRRGAAGQPAGSAGRGHRRGPQHDDHGRRDQGARRVRRADGGTPRRPRRLRPRIGAGSTRSSRPTSSIRSTSRASSRGAARRACRWR